MANKIIAKVFLLELITRPGLAGDNETMTANTVGNLKSLTALTLPPATSSLGKVAGDNATPFRKVKISKVC
ncbi:MAG: hypothetical protein WAO21_05450 [Verrucomicrobiia bacterium]